jgi:hypothetical protein
MLAIKKMFCVRVVTKHFLKISLFKIFIKKILLSKSSFFLKRSQHTLSNEMAAIQDMDPTLPVIPTSSQN